MFRMRQSTGWASSVGVVVLFLVAVALPAQPAEPPQSFWDWATGPSIYDEDGKRDWGVDHVGLLVGYRILGVDYRNKGFVYDVRQNGLLLGLTLRY